MNSGEETCDTPLIPKEGRHKRKLFDGITLESKERVFASYLRLIIDMGEEMREFLGRSIPDLDRALDLLIQQKETEKRKFVKGLLGGEFISFLLKGATPYIKKGKKVRGNLVLAGYCSTSGNKDYEPIIKAAAAMEILQGFILMHDDFMDKDELRRGNKTIHVLARDWAYERWQNELDDNPHFGNSMATNLGSAFSYWGNSVIFQTEVDPENKILGFEHLCKYFELTAYGQIQDILYERESVLSEEEILGMAEWKTGEYTIAGPLVLGGILGGASEEQKQAMREYGLNVGVAFQIKDDELGIYGDTKVTGKPSGNDIRTGKHTLFKKYVMEIVNGEDKKILEKSFGNRELDEKEIDHVREIIDKTGAREKAMAKARSLLADGKKFVPLITVDEYWQKVLIQLADYMVEREK